MWRPCFACLIALVKYFLLTGMKLESLYDCIGFSRLLARVTNELSWWTKAAEIEAFWNSYCYFFWPEKKMVFVNPFFWTFWLIWPAVCSERAASFSYLVWILLSGNYSCTTGRGFHRQCDALNMHKTDRLMFWTTFPTLSNWARFLCPNLPVHVVPLRRRQTSSRLGSVVCSCYSTTLVVQFFT